MNGSNKRVEDLIDYLNGELSEEQARRLTRQLAQEESTRSLFEELQELRDDVRSLPDYEPSNQLQHRFERQLHSEHGRQVKAKRRRLYAALSAAASALLLFGALIGWQFRSEAPAERTASVSPSKLLENRSKMAELMQRPEATHRVKATRVALEIKEPDREIIQNLGQLLNYDESTNVRLSALDALIEHSRSDLVMEVLLEALQHNQPVVVQLALIQALVDLGETRAVPLLDEWIENEDILRQVKDEARYARFKLT